MHDSERPSSIDFILAVRVGFEPTEPVKVQRFSRPPDSTTLAPHRVSNYQGFLILAKPPIRTRVPPENCPTVELGRGYLPRPVTAGENFPIRRRTSSLQPKHAPPRCVCSPSRGIMRCERSGTPHRNTGRINSQTGPPGSPSFEAGPARQPLSLQQISPEFRNDRCGKPVRA